MRIAWLGALAALAFLPGGAGAGDHWETLLDQAVRDAVAEGQTPGAVLLIGQGERVVLRKAYGFRSFSPERFPMTPETVFDVASLTKVVAAAPAVMLLVERGLLDLDASLRRYLPELREGGVGRVTIRQLLTHTGGLPAAPPDSLLKDGRPDLRGFARLPLESAPGERFLYSDTGFILLGELVRQRSGSPLDRFAWEQFYRPLGMRDTGYLPLSSLSECETGRIVSTGRSSVRGIEKVGEVDDENAAAMGGVAGHAGVFSTAHDLFLFSREILRARRGEGRVLSRASALRMTERVTAPEGCPRTPGWDSPTSDTEGGSQAGGQFSPNTVGHLGFSGCSLWIDLEREATVVLLTNRVYYGQDNGRLKALRPRIHDAVLAAMDG